LGYGLGGESGVGGAESAGVAVGAGGFSAACEFGGAGRAAAVGGEPVAGLAVDAEAGAERHIVTAFCNASVLAEIGQGGAVVGLES
jgi:hypothetical protein